MFSTRYTTVSDLAICQRCPALFGYKYHMHEKDVWREGIKGKGFPYGSIFHKNIAQVFFEIASDSRNPLHAKLGRAAAGGLDELEEFVRENIFMPFIERESSRYTSGQLTAFAEGVNVWVKAMHSFFREIPSLMKDPVNSMSTIFIEPEQKLQAAYYFPRNYGRLVVTGCYDALMFNPDKTEARLFEFKGYSKGDAAVPLAQSLMYAWLIERFSGIVPSVEIIYLDEENIQPDIFDPASVRSMIVSGLHGLFYAAFNTMTLRRLPEIMTDKDSCGNCRFKSRCASDWAVKFKSRAGASLINVMVFMMAAITISAQVFFFSQLSLESRALEMQDVQQRFKFDSALKVAVESIRNNNLDAPAGNFATYLSNSRYKVFWEERIVSGDANKTDTDINTVIYDLNYTVSGDFGRDLEESKWKLQAGENLHKQIFPPMGEGYYLIRVYEPHKENKKSLMYQVVVHKSGSSVVRRSFQEVWYD